MLKVKGGVTQGGPAAAAAGAKPGWAFPSLLGGICSSYVLPCMGLPFFSCHPMIRGSGVSPGKQIFPCLSFPTCTSKNYCWFLSFLPWPRAPGCCVGAKCLEPGLGTDLPTSHPTQLLQKQPRPWCWLHRKEVFVCSEFTVPPATPHLL